VAAFADDILFKSLLGETFGRLVRKDGSHDRLAAVIIRRPKLDVSALFASMRIPHAQV
jgi:hypothetical protein